MSGYVIVLNIRKPPRPTLDDYCVQYSSILEYISIEKILGRTELRGECYPNAGQAGENLRGCGETDQQNLYHVLLLI